MTAPGPVRVVDAHGPAAGVAVHARVDGGWVVGHTDATGSWTPPDGATWIAVPAARATAAIAPDGTTVALPLAAGPGPAWWAAAAAAVVIGLAAVAWAAGTLEDASPRTAPTAARSPGDAPRPADAPAADAGTHEAALPDGAWHVWPPEARPLATLDAATVVLRPSSDTTPPWALACIDLAGVDPASVGVHGRWTVDGPAGTASRVVVQAWPPGDAGARIDRVVSAHGEPFAPEALDATVTLPDPIGRVRLCAYVRGTDARLTLDGVDVR